MKKNYFSQTFFSALMTLVVLVPMFLSSQEPRVFTVLDFDLLGKVRSCEVITDYGKESFEFNEEGLLTKSITRYNEKDYDATYYKYQGSELAERRDEVYRDGVFDKNTSIAHLYDLDTTGRKKITERIVSYSEEFLDKYEYHYNLDDKLVKIIRSNNDGLDETIIKYTDYKGENTISHLLNGVIQKSIRTSYKKKKDGSKQKIELVKEFMEGVPNNAVENLYDKEGKLISQQNFKYDALKKSFAPGSSITYRYDDKDMLIAQFIKVNKTVEEKEFIYQFDNGESGNWVKKIVTPANSYTTRSIEYYPEEEVEIEE